MKFQTDTEYLLHCFRRLVETPSPVGCYRLLNPVLEDLAASFGHSLSYDRRGTPYLTIDGKDSSKTIMLSAHADTLGLMVRRIDADGMLRVHNLGNFVFGGLEGETVTVHTRDGRSYTGLFACQSHSIHAFKDAETLERNANTMMVILDEPVATKEDVLALGIRNGDYISIDPRCQVTPNGYLKSRFIDDKAGIACCFAMLNYLAETGEKPACRTILTFPYLEEVGLGGAYVPQEISEYVAVDIGLISPDCEGSEYKVSICAKDRTMPYDQDLTDRLVRYAEKAGCDYAVDTFLRYGSDGTAALRGGNNLRTAAFGMAVYCSHGMERTHITGLENTVNLLLAYILDI